MRAAVVLLLGRDLRQAARMYHAALKAGGDDVLGYLKDRWVIEACDHFKVSERETLVMP